MGHWHYKLPQHQQLFCEFYQRVSILFLIDGSPLPQHTQLPTRRNCRSDSRHMLSILMEENARWDTK